MTKRFLTNVSFLALLGFSPREALAEVREFKLARATETRNTCPYCSVSCGVLMYSLGDKSKNAPTLTCHTVARCLCVSSCNGLCTPVAEL